TASSAVPEDRGTAAGKTIHRDVLAWDPSSRVVYYEEISAGPKLAAFDIVTQSARILDSFPSLSGYGELAVAPNGTTIYYSMNGNSVGPRTIFARPVAGGRAATITDRGGSPARVNGMGQMVVSSDSRQLLYTAGDDAAYVYDVATNATRLV